LGRSSDNSRKPGTSNDAEKAKVKISKTKTKTKKAKRKRATKGRKSLIPVEVRKDIAHMVNRTQP